MFSLLKPNAKRKANPAAGIAPRGEGLADPGQPSDQDLDTASNPPASHPSEPSPNPTQKPHAAQQPIGAFMRFQYGSGDTPLDGYVIKRGIGIGGFGEVYFAESDSGKEVALKRIQKNLDVEMRGVRHCLNLRHPNLVAIYDIRYDADQQGWIVMEFIEGESLRDRLDRDTSGMAADEVMPMFAQIVAGVTYLHDQGIVHRDLKPANIFLENGMVKIGDYGLSKYISASRRGGQTESVGTFHYMAPEIGKGEYGKEIDVYSLGIILYEMITGDVPFDGESTQEILLKHLTADPDLNRVPGHYADVIGRCLAKNPSHRFADGRDLLRALGYELTAGGLAARALNAEFPVDRPVATGASAANTNASTGARTSAPNASYTSPHARAAAACTTPLQPFGARVSAFFSMGLLGHQRMLEREPIASGVIKSWSELQFKYQTMPKGGREFVLIFLLIALFINLSFLIALAIPAFWLYAIYYVIWFLNSVRAEDLNPTARPASPATKPPTNGKRSKVQYVPAASTAAAQPAFGLQETVHYRGAAVAEPVKASVVAKPVSTREALRTWQQTQRTQLQDRGTWTAFHAWTRSLTVSGFVVAIVTGAGGYLAMANERLSNADGLGGLVWLGIMAGLTSWAVLTFSRRWESRTEDSIAFRFTLMVAGLLLGAASYQLSEYLMVPWNDITRGEGVRIGVSFEDSLSKTLNRSWRGFYDANGVPMLAGHMAYFASLLWAVRWWRQSDVLRKKRFSLWPIVWSVMVAAVIQGIFYFPTPWCLLLAGLTSFSIQIASPWIEPHSQHDHAVA